MTVQFVKENVFQSTLLQEERHRSMSEQNQRYNFNPRSYKRSDSAHKWGLIWFVISIHAPTRGATREQLQILHLFKISIHAPTRGATIIGWLQTEKYILFQSTLLQEERLCDTKCCSIKVCNFNPRSYKRSDTCRDGRWKIWTYFNPRSYKRSDAT